MSQDEALNTQSQRYGKPYRISIRNIYLEACTCHHWHRKVHTSFGNSCRRANSDALKIWVGVLRWHIVIGNQIRGACMSRARKTLQRPWPQLQETPTASARWASNVPGSVQYVERPVETSSGGQAVQGGKPSELNEFDGHFPGRACSKGGGLGYITYICISQVRRNCQR